MPRLYVSNDSYPELREIAPHWEQSKTWFRALRSAFTDRRFWIFVAIQVAQWTAWWLIYRAGTARFHPVGLSATLFGLAVLAGAICVHAWLTVTWGGDMMRPHLRRASPIAREACPSCGHRLTDQIIAGTAPQIFCQECGETIPRATFEPPFPIPRRFLAVRWPRAQSTSP